MTKPEDKTENVAILRREKLERELGQLAYKIAICNTQIVIAQKQKEPLVQRSNEIANELGEMDNGKR